MRRLLLAATAAFLATACTASATTTPPAPDPGGTPSAAPTDGPVAAPIAASWEQGAAPVALPGGWLLTDCEGDMPALCLERGGTQAGLLALSSFPLTVELAAAEDDAARSAALLDFARSRYDGVAADRAAGCGDGYRFAADDPVAVQVGGRPGVRYGFTGTEGGAVTERVVTYGAVHAGQLWLVVAEGASAGGCMGSDELLLFEPSVLDGLLPTLDRVVAGTPLPAAGDRIEDGSVVGVDGGLDGGLLYLVAGGHKERVQQPRAMTRDDVAAAGLTWGPVLVRLELADEPTGSSFAVVPPDGPDARLHLISGGTIRPVVVQQVTSAAVAGLPDASGLQGRLRPAT